MAADELAITNSSEELPDQPNAAPDQNDQESELDGTRIRKLSALRRSAYRSRSYCLIAAAVCAAAAGRLIQMAYRDVRTVGWGLWPIAYGLAAIPAFWGIMAMLRRAGEFYREAQRSELPPVLEQPDFSSLSDGSQRSTNLQDLSE